MNIKYKCIKQKETNSSNKKKIVRISKTKTTRNQRKRRSLTETKARGKNENRWVEQTHTLTHSLTQTRAHTPTHPVPVSRLGGVAGDGGGQTSINGKVRVLSGGGGRGLYPSK